MNEQMQKLRDFLDSEGIEWQDASNSPFGFPGVLRTKFKNKKGEECSVVFGEGVSYGWQGGLLESMPCVHEEAKEMDEVEGWLTADDIIKEWF